MTKANPWNHGDRQLIIGDAAHSVVPFYGQGANAAFEDCLVFCETLDACNGDLSAAVGRFAETRKPAADALAALSLDNYVEMRHKTAVRSWLLRKKLDSLLASVLPAGSWMTLYSMVAFTRIPYHEARRRAAWQDGVLDWLATTTAVAMAAGVTAAGLVLVPRLLAAASARRG